MIKMQNFNENAASAPPDVHTATEWWNSKSEDDQVWLMLKFGFGTPFNPKRVTVSEMLDMMLMFK